jgi:hypothetical protein
MKVLLLLGSGISFPTGLPSVEQIMKDILTETWTDDSQLTFYRGENPSKYLRKQNIVPVGRIN